MIAHLKGKIISSKPTKVIVDVNNVGYEVNISISTFEKISKLEDVSLFIYTHVREDALMLFGFSEMIEKEMFELLISVNGIGPKLAQTILSGIRVDELKYAIETANISRITSIPGVGKKTAERLLVELTGKVSILSIGKESEQTSSVKNEAVAALTTLGYNAKNSERIIHEILVSNNNISLEEIIKTALSILNK